RMSARTPIPAATDPAKNRRRVIFTFMILRASAFQKTYRTLIPPRLNFVTSLWRSREGDYNQLASEHRAFIVS
ncbi:MAG: hypothetical protein ACYSUD_22370, partial [Planctomycetota bacterium]